MLKYILKTFLSPRREEALKSSRLQANTALPAAMRYILKAESYERSGAGRKTVLPNSRKRCIPHSRGTAMLCPNQDLWRNN